MKTKFENHSMYRPLAWLCATALLVGLASCGGGSGVVDAGSPPPPPTTPPSAGRTEVVARQGLDEDSPATSLQATLPDGSSVDLYLPQYAVRERAEVTVSALPAALTLPTGSVAGGVRLQPDGLKLGNASVLTLRVKGTLEQGKTLGFAIHGGIVTYHPVKVRHQDVNGVAYTSVDLPLLGFSDHGIVSNADPAVIAQAITASTPPLEVLYAALSGTLDALDAIELLTIFFNNHVKPALETAATLPEHPVNLETAMRLYLSWREQIVVMDAIHPGFDGAGMDPDAVNLLLEQAILHGVDHWNERCLSSFDPADARRAVTAWLWTPSVFLDRNAPLRKVDLQDKLCLKMEILGAELDALLESDQAQPLVIRTGLQVLAQPQRHDVPVRVRATQVLGGSVTGGPALSNAQGSATLSATVQGGNPGLAVVLNASVVGFADVLDRSVHVFRPRNGGQPKLITDKKFVGVVKYYFDRTPPECRQGREPGLEPLGSVDAELFIAGDPFAYVVTLKETSVLGGGVPPADWVAPLWEFRGEGDFNNVGGPIFSYGSGSGVIRVTDPGGTSIAGWTMALAVSRDGVQKLTGRMGFSCQYREIEMLPAPPPT